MPDASVPLTTNEEDEGCNPENKFTCYSMLAYSPHDNGAAKRDLARYLAGIVGQQVQYFEPRKCGSELRATNIHSRHRCYGPTWNAGTAASQAGCAAMRSRQSKQHIRERRLV